MVLNLYTTAVRAVPELILIVGLYYAGTDGINRILSSLDLPEVEINAFVAAVAVLGLVQGAYATEVLRGAILAIPIGQLEAARAFGVDFRRELTRDWAVFPLRSDPCLNPPLLVDRRGFWSDRHGVTERYPTLASA